MPSPLSSPDDKRRGWRGPLLLMVRLTCNQIHLQPREDRQCRLLLSQTGRERSVLVLFLDLLIVSHIIDSLLHVLNRNRGRGVWLRDQYGS